MCIIVAKPNGIEIPSEKIFENCIASNKDGIGLSYCLPGERPTIVKGFMNVKKLIKMINFLKIEADHNLVVHFRYATHGKNDRGNCHPFPLSSSFEDMRLLHCSCDCSIAHNGVFSGMPAHTEHSDTMIFISDVLASPEIIYNIEKPAIKTLINGYCGFSSKLAFLRPQGLSLVGDFIEDAGVYYSNSQFRRFSSYTPNLDTDKTKDGKTWCYLHKIYDTCKYCFIHKELDDCHLNTVEKWRNRFDDTKKLEFIASKCDWCERSLKVKWDNESQGYLCEECQVVLNPIKIY